MNFPYSREIFDLFLNLADGSEEKQIPQGQKIRLAK